MTWFIIRFFVFVVPPPLGLAIGWVTLLGIGTWWGLEKGLSTTGLLSGCLYLQMLGVSAGFMQAARAGYFDEALGVGRRRWATAVAHWLAVSWPGLLVWLLLGCVEAFGKGGEATSLRPSSLAALFWVSTAAWLLSLPFGRWSGALLWTSALILFGGSTWGGDLLSEVGGGGTGSTSFAMAVGTIGISPFLMLTPVETAVARADAMSLVILTLSVVALLAGVGVVHCQDYPLEFRR
ncbi:MAG: hypothetical protein QF681_05865 [Vicinamibacterales bacterium]|jgi:hypothetical protein|nr:hypothetical protein [Vicinamibacterales bacterium]